jgi:dethiobiotin synthetase
MKAGLFITGTDTGVGKTRVAAALLRAGVQAGLAMAPMKPVASGAEFFDLGDGRRELRNDDALALLKAAGGRFEYSTINPYCFEPAISPHIAAMDARVTVDPARLQSAALDLATKCDCLVVEGAGGWFAPIGPALTIADVAGSLKLPVLLVVGLRLGCLNHAMLSLQAIERSGLELAGWAVSEIDPKMPRRAENLAMLHETFGDEPLLHLGFNPTSTAELEAGADALRRLGWLSERQTDPR